MHKDFYFRLWSIIKLLDSLKSNEKNDVLKIGNSSAEIDLKSIVQLPISITFWLKIETANSSDVNINICNLVFGKYKFSLYEARDITKKSTLYHLKMIAPIQNDSEIELRGSLDDWQLFNIQIDEQAQVKFAISNTVENNNPEDLYKVANSSISYSAPMMSIVDIFGGNATPVNLNLKFAKQIKMRKIFIDDIRIYDKILTNEDLSAIATMDPYVNNYIAKYQFAYTSKQLGDQYYLMASDVARGNVTDPTLLQNALKYYEQARDALLQPWIDTTSETGLKLFNELKAFEFSSIDDIEKLEIKTQSPKNKVRNSLEVQNYYDLLLFDINYRLKLISNNYSFWGKDFTEKALFPVQEYQFFKDAYTKFDLTYQNLEALLKHQAEAGEKQEINELQSQLASSSSELERVKIDETAYKVGFYDQQIGNINSRLLGIEERQKYLTREVDRKEDALKKIDAKIMSQMSEAISSATLGVNIDVTKDLKSQVTQAGLSYLGGNPQLTNSLLGSYKDIYDVAVSSKEYYQKGVDIFETVRTIASGKATIDDVLKIGDAVSNSGFTNEEWKNEWKKMKKTYSDVQDQYKYGKELLAKVEMTANTPNLKNIVDFVDWMAVSDYIPENYKKEYEQFKNYREAAYTSVKDKRYNDIIDLGTKLIDDPSLTTEIERIKLNTKELKPVFILIEMIKKRDNIAIRDLITNTLLDGSMNNFLNENVKNEFLYTVLRESLKGEINQEAILQYLLNKSPEVTLKCFPFEVREDLSKLLEATSYQDLIDKLKTFTFARFTAKISVQKDILIIYGEHYKMDVSKYINFDKNSTKAIVELYSTYSVLKDDLKKATTPLEIYKIFEDIIIDKGKSRKSGEEFYDYIYARLDNNGKTAVGKEATAFYLGNGVFTASVSQEVPNNLIDKIPDLVDVKNPSEVIGENLGSMPSTDNSAAMRQLAAKALDMAFPGVGTAVNTVLNVADAVFSGYQIVDELRGVYTEKVKLNDEYVKLMGNHKEYEFNKQIALYETRMANISYNIMLQEHEGYAKMVNSIVEKKKDIRYKIGGYLPLMFFYAERLRYYYQRLNKSSVFWYGTNNSLNSIIFSDPNNLRLALDPDIKLFDWISTPDVTSSREDLFRLYSYWSKIYSLVTDGVTSNRLKYGENVTEISYKVIDLQEVDSEQWNNFQKWKQYPNLNFTYDLDLSNEVKLSITDNFDKSYTSIKTIQVIPIAIDDNAQRIENSLLITNTGLSTNEMGVVEPLSRKTRSSTDEFIELDKNGNIIVPTYYIKNLKSRWDSPNTDYMPGNFEGYNLRSDWKIIIDATKDVAKIKKIYFIVFYQYIKNYKEYENSAAPEYPYKVKVPYNLARGTNEFLNITLPENPNYTTSSVRYNSLLNKYPLLKSHGVTETDLQPYVDPSGNPLILRKDEEFKGFSKNITIPKKKGKCFLSKIF